MVSYPVSGRNGPRGASEPGARLDHAFTECPLGSRESGVAPRGGARGEASMVWLLLLIYVERSESRRCPAGFSHTLDTHVEATPTLFLSDRYGMTLGAGRLVLLRR